ncbi:enterochelin esterase domain-containing protein [Specibacter sp. AOP5-B1-6]|uniref:enterochelin esterase domain-containing protein n=1 Tax=Specibacter sp. AOP5-B1-6 TaxID=3457653 RepID=UPI003FB80CB9
MSGLRPLDSSDGAPPETARGREVFPAPQEMAAGPPPHIPVIAGHFSSRWHAGSHGERGFLLAQLTPGSPCRSPWIEAAPDGSPHHRAVTFLHRSANATAVILSANALVNHHDVAASEFERMAGTDLWALTYLMPADWECSYRITAHEGSGPAPWRAATERRAIRMAADAGGPDPLNPVVGAGMNGGAQSVLRLPLAPAVPWLADATVDLSAGGPVMGGVLAHGAGLAPSDGLAELSVVDSGTGRLRTVWVYAPPHGSPGNVGNDSTAGAAGRGTPLLILHDGQVWAKHLNLKATLDAAIRSGVVPPLHVAMVDSLDGQTRAAELSGPTGTVDFVAEDLLPLLRRDLPVRQDAAGTLVSGASYGGLASLWQVARHPHLVGVALAQSPSLWRYDLAERLGKVVDEVVLRLQAGLYEADIHQTSVKLLNDLAPRGADIQLQSVTGGHDWAWWNPWLIHGLAELLG